MQSYADERFPVSKDYVGTDRWTAAFRERGMFEARHGWVRDSLLRGAGVVLLMMCWLLTDRLFHSATLRQHHDPSLADSALAALGFLSFGAGGVLTTLGEHILDEIEISERWATHVYAAPGEGPAASSPARFMAPDRSPTGPISRSRGTLDVSSTR